MSTSTQRRMNYSAHQRFEPPTVEPVTLAEAKSAARIETTADDTDVDKLIVAARIDLEDATGRAFITQTRRLRLDRFPCEPIELKVLPVQEDGVEIRYFDSTGSEQTVDPATYIVNVISEPARVYLLPGNSWPATDGRLGAVTIDFVCGYGDAGSDVPENIQWAIKQIVSERYDHRKISSTRKGTDEAFQKEVRLLSWGAYP